MANPTPKIDEISQKLGSLEATVLYLSDQIHQLRKEIKERSSYKGVVYLLGVCVTCLFGWLGVLTAAIMRR